MQNFIDIPAAIVLLLFFYRGWKKGLMLASMGVFRVVLAAALAYFAGRYLGSWLAVALYRPRIVMIPATAGLTFVLVTFGFQVAIWRIQAKRRALKEKENFRLPWYRCLPGGLVSAATGLLTLIFVFWLADLVMTGITGRGIPGADESVFGRFARRAAYEGVYAVTARKGRESQGAAMARVISHPAQGIDHLQRLLEAESLRQLFTDRQLAQDLINGDAEQIRNNASIQQLFHDEATRAELQQLGIISRRETDESFSEKLSRFGRNEKIRASIQDLQARDLLRTDRILLLIRDPEFDIIVAEVVK